jgi:hypothetical protein
VPTINAKNVLTTGPREVPELEVQKLETWMAGLVGGAGGRSGNGHHQSWRRIWRVPYRVLAAGPAAATTEVGDINGEPLGVLSVGPGASTIEVEDVDGGPLGVLPTCLAAATTEVEDVDGGLPGQQPPPKLETSMACPLWGAVGICSSGHHWSPSEIHEVSELKVREHPPSV